MDLWSSSRSAPPSSRSSSPAPRVTSIVPPRRTRRAYRTSSCCSMPHLLAASACVVPACRHAASSPARAASTQIRCKGGEREPAKEETPGRRR